MSNSTSKDFNIVKAEQLCLSYIKNRQAAKTEFISELISYQHFFGDVSIVNCKLILNRHYQKKTVESVLSDLGYKIVSFYSQTRCAYILNSNRKHICSVLTFTTA